VPGLRQGLYQVDLDTGDYKRIASGLSGALGSDGHVVAHSEFNRKDLIWGLFAGQDKDTTLLSVTDPFHDFALLGLGRTLGTVIVERPDKADGTLWELPVSGGAPVSLTAEPNVGVIYGDDGLARGLQFEGARQHAEYFDPAKDKKVRMVVDAFEPSHITVISRSADFNRFIVKSTGPDDAGTYYVVDVAAQKVDRIGQDYPAIGPGQIGPSRMVAYEAADGMKLEGVLTLPPGPEVKNRPVIVLPHGGPAARDHLGFDWMAQAFASRGYAVFQPNFRGSTGYGTTFQRAGDGEWGRKMQSDISDGVAELARLGIVDPKRAAIVGASYGGYAALAGVTVQHGLYRCAVSIGGVASPNDFLDWIDSRHGHDSMAVKYMKRALGTDSLGDDKLDPFSPVEQAAKADAPILLIYGKDDTVVPTRQSEAMAKALQKAGKPVQVVVLKEEDHWLSREPTRIQALQESVTFVLQHNPPN
jgi:dipeptidyl aminopeptidase/acylaminoacyl peptidase